MPVVGTHGLRFAVLSDIGSSVDSRATIANLISAAVESEAAEVGGQHPISAVLVPGDISYADNDGLEWDAWQRMVQPLAAWKPWMVTAGNHEIELDRDNQSNSFAGFRNRFRMPGKHSDEESSFTYKKRAYVGYNHGNFYYSYTAGTAHVIFLSSYSSCQAGSEQHSWLLQNLKVLSLPLSLCLPSTN